MLRVVEHEAFITGIGNHVGSKGTAVLFASLNHQLSMIVGQRKMKGFQTASDLLQIRFNRRFRYIEFISQIKEIDCFFCRQEAGEDDHDSFLIGEIGMFRFVIVMIKGRVDPVFAAIGKDHRFLR